MTHEPLNVNDIVEGEVNSLAFGGEGIVRHNNMVIFVPFTAPGDSILCQINEVKKNFAKGTLQSILKPSSMRTPPLCPYFGRCGGCQIQHLLPEAQNEYKLRSVVDALTRIGHLQQPEIKFIPATHQWAYRRHVTLHLRSDQDAHYIGYIGADHHSFVSVATCPIFIEDSNPILHRLLENLQKFPLQKQEGRLTLLKQDKERYILYFQFEKQANVELNDLRELMRRDPLISGIILKVGNKKISCGDVFAEIDIESLRFRFSPEAFVQNNPEESEKIYRKISNLFKNQPKKRILDLYCGFGIMSLILAKQGHYVEGIEYNPAAIEFGKENARLNKIQNVRFSHGDVEKLLPMWTHRKEVDAVILNPPRAGISPKVLETLLKMRPNEIIYVSCMPSTLARDLSMLCKNEYILKECEVYDMFPQTSHVETLVLLQRIQ